jgi:hypothetical protein
VGRFWGVDPIASDFVFVTPYNYAENRVPNGIDLWGLQFVIHIEAQRSVEKAQWTEEERREYDAGRRAGAEAIGRMVAEELPGIGEAISISEGDWMGLTFIGNVLERCKNSRKNSRCCG